MKNFCVDLSPLAQADIENALDHIAFELSNPQAALNLQSKFAECFENLSSFPFLGTQLKANAPLKRTYRWILVENYLVFYTVDQDGGELTVMRVLFGTSDYLAVLNTDEKAGK